MNRSYAWAAAHVDRASARAEWRKARRIFRERLEEINGLIRLYNLQVPPTVGQRFILTEADELKRLGLPDELD